MHVCMDTCTYRVRDIPPSLPPSLCVCMCVCLSLSLSLSSLSLSLSSLSPLSLCMPFCLYICTVCVLNVPDMFQRNTSLDIPRRVTTNSYNNRELNSHTSTCQSCTPGPRDMLCFSCKRSCFLVLFYVDYKHEKVLKIRTTYHECR